MNRGADESVGQVAVKSSACLLRELTAPFFSLARRMKGTQGRRALCVSARCREVPEVPNQSTLPPKSRSEDGRTVEISGNARLGDSGEGDVPT